MSKTKKDKKIPLLEASYEEVSVCKKNSFKPQIEIFIQKPENISQQNLGILAGIFEITDDSEDSSYIVNYLVSIIKKEYYSREKRDSIESFEASLHKVNLALAKIAEHGNTNWLGKINGIVSVIEKNNIHIAQTGKVQALLLRETMLTNISEGVTKTEELNPLKTFIDVLSGRLKNNDKIIITTEDIFNIFSLEEIKRGALKFSSSAFVQFLKTALVNELDKASVLIVDIKEKELPKNISPVSQKTPAINAFSQTSFSKYLKKKNTPEKITSGEKQAIVDKIKEDLEKKSGEFVDKKTGHIYIKEDHFLKYKESFLNDFLENKKDKIGSFFQKKIFSRNWKNVLFEFSEKNPDKKIENKKIKDNLGQSLENIAPEKTEGISESGNFLKKVLGASFFRAKEFLKVSLEKKFLHINSFFSALKKIIVSTFNFSAEWLKKIVRKKEKYPDKKEIAYAREEMAILAKKKREFFTSQNVLFSFLPKFSKIKGIFSALNYPQKIYALLAIAFILVFPFVFIKLKNRPKENILPPQANPVVAPIPLENDKNVRRITDLSEVNFEKDILKIIPLNGAVFAVSKNEVINIQSNEKYSVPNDFLEIKTASGMDDLNLIFVSNQDNRLLAWSPISKKFQENQIIFPEKADISFQKTYLTYLYALDKTNNQIYRYPRASGGFGEKINWLKDSADLEKVSAMAINENIFLAEAGNISLFFQGKKQPFQLEETATPIRADRIWAKRNSPNIFILDKINSRIAKLDLNGNIVSQFHNPEISRTTDFEVAESENILYFSFENKIKNFKM